MDQVSEAAVANYGKVAREWLEDVSILSVLLVLWASIG